MAKRLSTWHGTDQLAEQLAKRPLGDGSRKRFVVQAVQERAENVLAQTRAFIQLLVTNLHKADGERGESNVFLTILASAEGMCEVNVMVSWSTQALTSASTWPARAAGLLRHMSSAT